MVVKELVNLDTVRIFKEKRLSGVETSGSNLLSSIWRQHNKDSCLKERNTWTQMAQYCVILILRKKGYYVQRVSEWIYHWSKLSNYQIFILISKKKLCSSLLNRKRTILNLSKTISTPRFCLQMTLHFSVQGVNDFVTTVINRRTNRHDKEQIGSKITYNMWRHLWADPLQTHLNQI